MDATWKYVYARTIELHGREMLHAFDSVLVNFDFAAEDMQILRCTEHPPRRDIRSTNVRQPFEQDCRQRLHHQSNDAVSTHTHAYG